jgi:predicted nucleic acid-binding protein
MDVVVDADLIVALVLPLPYSDHTAAKITAWKRTEIELLAPLLLEYEVSAVLRKAIVAGLLTTEGASEAMRRILDLHIRCLPPTRELHEHALLWAERLGHTITYNAHYVALAEQQQAELWTADRGLVNAARQAKVTWLHWIGEETSAV